MGHSLVPADLQIRAVWQGDSTRWPEGTPFRRALIQVARLYPLPPSLGENLALPLFSQTFSSSTLPGTALSQEIVVVHLPSCICNPMDHSVPDLPVPHHFLKFAQVHVHCIGDAHPAISFSVTFFFPQSCAASETFPASHLFTSDDQYSKPSASASVLLTSIQG